MWIKRLISEKYQAMQEAEGQILQMVKPENICEDFLTTKKNYENCSFFTRGHCSQPLIKGELVQTR